MTTRIPPVTHNGQTRTLREWARATGIPYLTLYNRVVTLGWPIDKAMSALPSQRQRYVTAFGETKTFHAWTQDPRCSISFAGLQNRIRAGMKPEDAISSPRKKVARYDIRKGQKFGSLTVIEDCRIESKPDGHKHTVVTCECECGAVVTKSGLYLKRGENPHCGCKNKPPGKPATRTKEEKAEVQKRWRIRNRAMRKMYIREWKLRNPGKVAAYHGARRLAEVVEWSEADQAAVAAIYDQSVSDAVIPCYLCGCDTHKGERHVDHKKALAKGGAHTADNLGIACVSCNLSKRTKSVEECR